MAEYPTTERLEFLALNFDDRQRASKEGHAGRYGAGGIIAEEGAMARELLKLRREVERLSADRYAKQKRREAAEARVAELSGTADGPLLQRLEADAQGYLACRQQEGLRPGLEYTLADEAWSFARRMEQNRREVVKRLQRAEDEEVQQ